MRALPVVLFDWGCLLISRKRQLAIIITIVLVIVHVIDNRHNLWGLPGGPHQKATTKLIKREREREGGTQKDSRQTTGNSCIGQKTNGNEAQWQLGIENWQRPTAKRELATTTN